MPKQYKSDEERSLLLKDLSTFGPFNLTKDADSQRSDESLREGSVEEEVLSSIENSEYGDESVMKQVACPKRKEPLI